MDNSIKWRQVWEKKSREDVPDFELDRGISPREQEIEDLSERELVDFIAPKGSETILDAGCGTGVNVFRLHSRASNVIGLDYAWGSVQRCQRRIQAHNVQNAHVCLASVMAIPLSEFSVDRIVCMSVLQYLDDEEVRGVLREFVRVLTPGGIMILHVKNSFSLYWSTLWVAKKLKTVLGWTPQAYYLRSFRWYLNELASLNCKVIGYSSFNLLTVDFMPKRLISFLQRSELRHYAAGGLLFRLPFVRRHGADLKIKAEVVNRRPGPSDTMPISPQQVGSKS